MRTRQPSNQRKTVFRTKSQETDDSVTAITAVAATTT